jgi:hypothetical protein
MAIVYLGVDLAKNVFAVHGVDEGASPRWCARQCRVCGLRRLAKPAVAGGCNEGLGRTLPTEELEAKDADHDECDASDAHDG